MSMPDFRGIGVWVGLCPNPDCGKMHMVFFCDNKVEHDAVFTVEEGRAVCESMSRILNILKTGKADLIGPTAGSA